MTLPELHVPEGVEIHRCSTMGQRMRRFLAANPFLSVGLLGIVIFAVWLVLWPDPGDGGVGQALFYVWRVLAAPVHLAANVLAPITDRWPDALDGGAAAALGLVPYLAADALWRRWSRHREPQLRR
jgi:hypothetical protein